MYATVSQDQTLLSTHHHPHTGGSSDRQLYGNLRLPVLEHMMERAKISGRRAFSFSGLGAVDNRSPC
ncbi:hypothetical protein PM082_007796 [Marasmius tenuissimus]|nr:hypothetical protein PM082_007796 [Marasmius tenuissimus]